MYEIEMYQSRKLYTIYLLTNMGDASASLATLSHPKIAMLNWGIL